MNDKIKTEWVNALRYGNYTKCKGQLHQTLPDGTDAFCALGVLGNVVQPSYSYDVFVDANGCTLFELPYEVQRQLGLTAAEVNLIVTMNDDGPDGTFDVIATYVEMVL